MTSLAESIYFRSPVWAQNLMVSTVGWQLHRRRYGRRHDRHLELLGRLDEEGLAAIRSHQRELLREMVAHAFATVPHYRDVATKLGIGAEDITCVADLMKLPILEKETIRTDPASLCSSAFGPKDLFVLHTSGTSGKALTLYGDVPSRQRHYAFWSRLRRHQGLEQGAPRATLFGRIICRPEQTSPPFWRYDRIGANLLMSSYHLAPQNLPHYIDALARYRPHEILGYASSVFLLARHVVQTGRNDVRPKVVITTADKLLPHYRDLIEEAFDCPVVDQYGCSEMAIFAARTGDAPYAVDSLHGILEVVDEEGQPVAAGETGEAVCTGLVNRAMPLIRYRLGDRITVDGPPTLDAVGFESFAEIEGRVDDILVAPDGRPLGRFSPIWKVVDGIFETQVVQNDRASLDVYLVVDADFRDDGQREEALTAEIRKRTGPDMAIRLHFVDEIEKDRNGKFKTVIANVER